MIHYEDRARPDGFVFDEMKKEAELKNNRIIRATITVEVPYSNELMNYGDKLNKKIKQVIADADYIPHETQAGNLKPSKRPVLKETK